MLFGISITEVTDRLKNTIANKDIELTACLKGYRSPDGKIYICSTCKKSLYEKRMPVLAVANGLEITDLEQKYQLTELENNLIAQNINFQKMILLPKSRWAAGKGRMVSVPVGAQDVMNTLKQVPRLPEEAGLIPIKLKRKKQYLGHEKKELARPEKLFKTLKRLKEMGHPYYQCYDTQEQYTARCRQRDERRERILREESDNDDIEENINEYPIKECFNAVSDEIEDDLEEELSREERDINNDPVRRQHFNYHANSVLVNGHPEILLDDNGNQVADLHFAPAEGKIPENFLDQKDWDIKSWPTLYPDGKFGMDYPRELKVTSQKYFKQRLLNKNDKFAKTPGFVFGAASYVESERLRSNANISGYRGKKEKDDQGQVSYCMKNPFTVFDKVPNTPKYWQNVRYEMIAKMENMGSFHWFFTLSCGDMRWCANFSSYFKKKNLDMFVDKEGLVWITEKWEEGKVLRKGWEKSFNDKGEDIMKTKWDHFKDSTEFKNEVSTHEEIRNNVLLATRNFQHRVEMFRNEVIFGSNNPMKVRHITYRVEFQGRGAGHIHGVMWVDLEEINKEMKEELREEIDKLATEIDENGVVENRYDCETVLIDAYENLRKSKKLTNAERRSLELFADKFCKCSLNENEVGEKVAKIAEDVNEHGHSKSCRKGEFKCRWKFPRFPLAETVFVDKKRNIPEGELILDDDRVSILNRVKSVLIEEKNGKVEKSKAVSDIMKRYPKNKESIGKRIQAILDIVNEDGGDKITYNLYKRAVEQQPEKGCKLYLRRDIDEIFINNYNPEWLESWDSNIDISLVSDFYGAITYITDYWTKDSSGITDVLATAVKQLNKDDDMRKKCHELANIFISHRQIGEAEAFYKLFPNMNLTYSSVATIYIPTDAKNERNQFLQKQDPEARKGFQVKDKIGRFLEKPDMISKYERRMRDGGIKSENIEDPTEETDCQRKNRELEEEAIDKLCYAQFAKMYETCWEGQDLEEYGALATRDKSNFVMDGDDEETGKDNEDNKPEKMKSDQDSQDKEEGEKVTQKRKSSEHEKPNKKIYKGPSSKVGSIYKGSLEENSGDEVNEKTKEPLQLPLKIKLNNPLPGEPPYLRRRSFPKAIRFFKQKEEVNKHKYFLQQLIMFLPFKDERDLFPDDPRKCENLYRDHEKEINNRKAKVLPFLESVQEARRVYNENKELDDPDLEEVGAMLDPEKEQEIIDAEDEEEEDHPEYLHIDPDQVEDEAKEEFKRKRVFRAIEIPSNQERLEEARKLDKMQRYVLSVGLKYAKGIIKARKGNSELPSPPNMMVHGGAGSGKSSVIKPLAEWIQDTLQEEGDDPDSPYVVLSSFTGAASANINGQTLHSLFGFKFGTKFISLSDQKREETRCQFRNLKIVIVDEVSMISADLFYNFDLKMREIMQVNKPFGGLAIFFFGDLFQLRPPKGKYPFEEPQNREHSVVFHLRNLWETFTVVILEENHRQGDDKTYADLLNRVRSQQFTDEDIEVLETRVRDGNHQDIKSQDDALHIYGTNSKVNTRNDKKVNEITGELIEIKAENRHRMMRNFKPKIDAAGCVLNTPFQALLKLKRGAQVIMVHNVDTIDGLTNGARGVLVDVEKSKTKDGTTIVKRLIIQFHNSKHGKEQRERHHCKKYPEATYINPMWWQYTLGGSTAEVYQFPVKMAAAITAHKIQV